ncbi:hypothetical protein KFU94_68645 [Chloroflexi bacterium TSY]|nr:hypothetical protein [Chloroflexi bacterium TSY]
MANHLVHFRRSCDKEFRYFLSNWLVLRASNLAGFGLYQLVKGPLGQSLSSGFSQPLAGHSLKMW